MKPKGKILIVEDEAILYERLKRALVKEFYQIADYCPSYDEALKAITLFQPEIVLLDIDLKGEKTGLDLGKKLHEDHKIPFIYLTEYDDEQTFYSGLNTKHAYFLVKTKPVLNIKEILRAIQTILNNQNETPIINQEGIFCLVDYLENIKNASSNMVSRKPVRFEDIVYFTNREFVSKDNIITYLNTNYLRVKTINNEDPLLLKISLIQLEKLLPDCFVRVSDSYIINLRSKALEGRINGSRVQIADEIITVSKNFKDNFNLRLQEYFILP